MIFKKRLALLHTIFLIFLCTSCDNDFFKRDKCEDNDILSVEEVQEIFYGNATGITLPVYKEVHTKCVKTDNSAVMWAEAKSMAYTDFYSVSVPIDVPEYAKMLMLGSRLGESDHYGEMEARSSLVSQRIKRNGTVIQFVVTIVGFKADRAINDARQAYDYHGDRNGFYGYYIISSTDGRINSFYICEKGKRTPCGIFYSVSLPKMRTNEKCLLFLDDEKAIRTKGTIVPKDGICTICGFKGIAYTDVGICLACGYAYDLPGITVRPNDWCFECGSYRCNCRRGSTGADWGDYNPGEETPRGCEICGRYPCICSGGSCGGGGGGGSVTLPSSHSKYIEYDCEKTKEMFEDAISELKRKDYKVSRLMDYVESKGEKITIKEPTSAHKEDYLYLYSYHPTEGNIIYYKVLGVEANKVGHELAHFWYMHEYPNIKLKLNLNTELISTLAELVYSIDTYNGEYYLMSKFYENEIRDIIKPFWDNPNYDNLDAFISIFRERRPQYSDFVLDRESFIDQVNHFKNLFK